MNCVNLIGRLTADPNISYKGKGRNKEISCARYTLAVDRPRKKDAEVTADFIQCVCFGKSAEFVSNYLEKGMKIGVSGRIQTGSFDGKDGNKVYTTDVVVGQHEFCQSKKD